MQFLQYGQQTPFNPENRREMYFFLQYGQSTFFFGMYLHLLTKTIFSYINVTRV